MKVLDRLAAGLRRVVPNRTADRLDAATRVVRAAEAAVDEALEDPALLAQVAARLRVNCTPEVAEGLRVIQKRLERFRVPAGRPSAATTG